MTVVKLQHMSAIIIVTDSEVDTGYKIYFYCSIIMSDTQQVKGSENYVWFLDQLLGRGSMGVVVLARHRKKGSKFAAKVYDPESKMAEHMRRELDILQRVGGHLHVVKLHAIEKETHTKSQVVIMELCDGGSLQQLLDQPQNYYGLPEEEFLIVFKHTCQALNYLHSKRIVHRDIKPGNILLQIAPDGRHIYKMTDFGAAKLLHDDSDNLTSICGTEEYIHPQLHTSAFIRRVPTSLSGFSVDLWSFGVTIYQCATGKLPFRPKDGIRQDKHMMNELMTKRPPAVISRYQIPDGQIVNETELPQTCKLYRGTSEYIVRVLKRLFNIKHPWSDSEFHQEMEKFCSKRVLVVFSLHLNKFISVHLNANHSLIRLKEELSKYTHTASSNQLLFTKDGELDSVVTPGDSISNYPDTSAEDPIMVISTKADDMSTCARDTCAHAPQLRNIQIFCVFNIKLNAFSNFVFVVLFPASLPEINTTLAPLVADAKWAAEVCGNIYLYQHVTVNLILNQGHLLFLRTALNAKLRDLSQILEHMLWHLRESQNFQKRLFETLNKHMSMHHHMEYKGTGLEQKLEELNVTVRECGIYHQKLERRYECISEHLRRYESMSRKGQKPNCVTHDHCKEKADIMIKDVSPMYQTILEDRQKEQLGHNEMEIHKYNRSELKRVHRRFHECLSSHCVQNSVMLYEETQDVICHMLRTWSDLRQLEQDVVGFDTKLKRCGTDIIQVLLTNSPFDTCTAELVLHQS